MTDEDDYIIPLNLIYPNSKPDIKDVLENLRMLMGYFMAKDDKIAMLTVYHAEQFIMQNIFQDKVNNVLTKFSE